MCTQNNDRSNKWTSVARESGSDSVNFVRCKSRKYKSRIECGDKYDRQENVGDESCESLSPTNKCAPRDQNRRKKKLFKLSASWIVRLWLTNCISALHSMYSQKWNHKFCSDCQRERPQQMKRKIKMNANVQSTSMRRIDRRAAKGVMRRSIHRARKRTECAAKLK